MTTNSTTTRRTNTKIVRRHSHVQSSADAMRIRKLEDALAMCLIILDGDGIAYNPEYRKLLARPN